MGVTPLPSLDAAVGDLAYTDDLTGLFNQRLLKALFEQHWMPLLADHERLALMVIDLDRFKEVNDTYGHLAGDDVLRTTAAILRRHFRGDDVIVRYGGDEFVVVMPGVGLVEAGRIGVRAREALSAWNFETSGTGTPVEVPLSFSIGVACYPEDGRTGPQLLREADHRLLDDKRNRQGSPVTTPGPRPSIPLRALVLTGILLLTVLLTGLLVVTSRPPSPSLLAIPPEREAALQARILSLQQQLGEVVAEAERASDAQREDLLRRQVGELTATIRDLEGQLQASPRATAGPGPAAVPLSTPIAQPTAFLRPSPSQGTEGNPVTLPAAPTPATSPPVVPPALLNAVQPAYPTMALRARREASVELRVLVDAEGRVRRVETVGPPAGFGFDPAAREAALAGRYRPGTRDGVPVEMETTLVVRFRLDQQR